MYLIEAAPLTSIPRPNPQILTYFFSQQVPVGSLILVPVFKRQVPALVLSVKEVSQQKMAIKHADYLMRSVIAAINPQPVLVPTQIKLGLWLSQYYWAPLGRVFKSMLPAKRYWSKLQLPAASKSVILTPRWRADDKVLLIPEPDCQPNFKQYFPLIQSAISNQQSAIILVPEIRQIKSWQKKLQTTFGQGIAILHSRLTEKEYFNNWLAIRQGQAKIILGTRQAVLTPVSNLGLVIITQEHSPFYKSFDQKPYLQARDVVLKLAQLTNAKIILSSATLSVESYWQTKYPPPPPSPFTRGRVNLANLPSPPLRRRARACPERSEEVGVIDLRQEIKAKNFLMISRQLEAGLKNILQQKKQALLFISRKGLASAILCRDCGRTIICPQCSVPLVHHLSGDFGISALFRPEVVGTGQCPVPTEIIPQLLCHHCGWQQTAPDQCPACRSHWLKPVGGGTQKLLSQVQQLLPQGRLAIFDKDQAPKPKDEKMILKNWLAKKIDILIATPLIFNLEPRFKTDFIAVVNIDRQLHLPDFRSSERVWQILKRLQCLLPPPIPSPFLRGRDRKGDKFLIQTYNPKNDVLQAIAQQNDQLFYQKEIASRARLFYPPFSHLVKLTFKHRLDSEAQKQAQILKAKLDYAIQKVKDKIKILGPAAGFIPKIKNQFIWQIILKVHPKLMLKLPTLLGIIPSQWSIDIDPESLLS